MKSLFSRKLEKVSREIFERYPSELSKLVGTSHGVYALYDENELYYVGKARDLKRRIRQHLKDRHFAQWTHFSLFLTSKSAHIHDIESVIILISYPKGNRVKPKNIDSTLKKELQSLVRKRQKEEDARLFGQKNSRKKIRNRATTHPDLKKFFTNSKSLFKRYKGKEYKAELLTSGKIKYKNKLYTSPTGAAKAVVDSGHVNGWDFWYIKNKDGDWVKLSSLR